MVIKMRYLLFFLVLFLQSGFSFAQVYPNPVCPDTIELVCSLAPNCSGKGPLWSQVGSIPNCNVAYPGAVKGICAMTHTCGCPAGFKINTIIVDGKSITSCIPDDTTEVPPDECEPPQVMYAGLCRDGEDSPGDCGGTYDTAVFVDGRYVCASGGCEAAAGTSVYTNANGSWSVCGSGDDEDPPSSSPSSNPSNPSSEPSSGGSGSSSGGTGGGDDDGDGTGSGGGSGDGTGNGTGNGSGNSSGGQTSSVAGGGGGTPTQSASSTSSSAHGAASSGSGAGNCDPTAHDYLDCISRENPGEGGDGIGDINQEGYELDIQQRLQQARDKYTNKVTEIKQDFESELSLSLSTGGGSLPTKSVNLFGENVDLGIASRSDFFDLIRWLFVAIASVVSVYILFAPR